jgi:hyaluronoglucosaminidase
MLELPWRIGERLTAIHLLSGLRGNAYLYSPKCDPYARDQWQTPYPVGSSDEQVIRVALHEAERNMLDFIWAVSPGVNGLAAVDPAILEAKIDAMRKIGVSHFGLFLDDIDDHAPGPQIALINRIDDYIRKTAPNERLLVVGTTYCGHSGNFYNCEGPNAYTDQLGAQVHPTVDFMWTGEDVIPPTMSAADMTAINASFRRTVTIWDNWPETATGFTGRSKDLGTAVRGYFSSPLVSEKGAPIRSYFKVLGPIADYLWAPERYDAPASYADWQPRLDAIDAVDAFTPCGNRPDGWICDDTNANRIYFCDPSTKCLSAHACPGGCVVGAPGVEDVCN